MNFIQCTACSEERNLCYTASLLLHVRERDGIAIIIICLLPATTPISNGLDLSSVVLSPFAREIVSSPWKRSLLSAKSMGLQFEIL